MKLFSTLFFVHCVLILGLSNTSNETRAKPVPALKFTVQPKGTIAEQGSEVVLDCSATGSDSSVSFRWLLNDTLLLIDGKKYQLSGQGSLKVHRLHRIKDDGNVFRCIASNRYGSILSVKAVVHVAFLHLILPPQKLRFYKQRSETVEMHAPLITSFPGETYKWQRQNTVDSTFEDISDGQEGRFLISLDGRTLYIMDVAIQDGGNYRCTVSNPLVPRRFTVAYSLRITTRSEARREEESLKFLREPANTTAMEGDSRALMECIVESRPTFPPGISWLDEENKPLPTEDPKYSYPSYGPEFSYHRMIIHNITLDDDESEYSCQATIGRKQVQSQKAKLRVIRMDERPSFTTLLPLEIKRIRGSDVLVPSYASNGELTWYKNAVETSELRNPRLTVQSNGSLVIRNVTSHDSGMYQLFARNYGEEISDTVRVIAAEPLASACAGPVYTLLTVANTFSTLLKTAPPTMTPYTVWQESVAPSSLPIPQSTVSSSVGSPSLMSVVTKTKSLISATAQTPALTKPAWTSVQPTVSIISPTTDVEGDDAVHQSTVPGGISIWMYVLVASCIAAALAVVVTCIVCCNRRKRRGHLDESKEEIELAALSRTNDGKTGSSGKKHQNVESSELLVNCSVCTDELYAEVGKGSGHQTKGVLTKYCHRLNGISNQAFDGSTEAGNTAVKNEPSTNRRREDSPTKKSPARQTSSSGESDPLYDVACEPRRVFQKDMSNPARTTFENSRTPATKDNAAEPLYHVLEATLDCSSDATEGSLNAAFQQNKINTPSEYNTGFDSDSIRDMGVSMRARDGHGGEVFCDLPEKQLEKKKFREFALSSSDSGDYEPLKQVAGKEQICQPSNELEKRASKSELKQYGEDIYDAVGGIIRVDNFYQPLKTSKKNRDRKDVTKKSNFYTSLQTGAKKRDPIDVPGENIYQPLNPSTLIQPTHSDGVVLASNSSSGRGTLQSSHTTDLKHRTPVPSPRTPRKRTDQNVSRPPIPSPRLPPRQIIPPRGATGSPQVPSLNKVKQSKGMNNENGNTYMPLLKTDK